VRDIWNLRKK